MRIRRIVDIPEHIGGEIHYRHHEHPYAHDPELAEAYECGKKHGWREAMEEAESYKERHYPVHGGHILYREHDHYRDPEEDEVVYRRHRNALGRYSRY